MQMNFCVASHFDKRIRRTKRCPAAWLAILLDHCGDRMLPGEQNYSQEKSLRSVVCALRIYEVERRRHNRVEEDEEEVEVGEVVVSNRAQPEVRFDVVVLIMYNFSITYYVDDWRLDWRLGGPTHSRSLWRKARSAKKSIQYDLAWLEAILSMVPKTKIRTSTTISCDNTV